MNTSVPEASRPSRAAISGPATRISPSAPTPKCRSHRAATRAGVSSISPRQSSSMTKSFPVPCHFSNRSSATLQVLRQLVGDRARSVRAGPEPADAGVPPEPPHLSPGQGPGPLHGPGQGLVQGRPAGQMLDDLSVPDGLARGEGWTRPIVQQSPDLVQEPAVDHGPDPCLDAAGQVGRLQLHPGRANRLRRVPLPVPGVRGERPAGHGGHLQGPDRPPDVRGLDLGRRAGVAGHQAGVQPGGAHHASLALELAADVGIGPRERQAVHHRAEVQARPPHHERRAPSRGDPLQRLDGQDLEPRHGEGLTRPRHVHQVVRDVGPFAGGGLGGAHVHAPVHQHGVHREHLGPQAPGHGQGGLGLAGCRGPHQGRPRTRREHVPRAQPAATSARPRRSHAGTGRPKRWCGWARSTTTSRNAPGASVPSKCTTLFVRVRPWTPPLRPVPSTRTSTVRPSYARLRSSEMRSCTVSSRSNRSWTTSFGTWSSNEAAAVPGRGEYWNVYALSNRASSTTRSVPRKSSSVSPGNPTMMSVENAIPGTASRIRRTQDRYRSERYDRRMARRTRSDPDCSGKWMCSHTRSHSAMASITSGVKSCGCGLVNRIRRRPSTPSTARRSSANRDLEPDPGTVRSRPYVFTFCPSSVTSTTPEAASPWTSARTSPSGRDRWGPRTSGTMQNEHRLSHPTLTLTHARWRSPRTAGSALGNTSVYSRTSIWGPSASARRISSSSDGRACVPTTTSTHGARRWIRPRSFWARHPATTIRIRGLAIFRGRRCPSCPYRRLSAFSRMAHVLRTTTSASAASSVGT